MRVLRNVVSVGMLFGGVIVLSSCQTNNVDTAQSNVSTTVQPVKQVIKQKPFDKDLDPNDMENNPFAFNRM